MNMEEIFAIALIVLLTVNVIYNSWFNTIVLKENNKTLVKVLEEQEFIMKGNDLAMQYCLNALIEKALKDEDFETAQLCHSHLKIIKERLNASK